MAKIPENNKSKFVPTPTQIRKALVAIRAKKLAKKRSTCQNNETCPGKTDNIKVIGTIEGKSPEEVIFYAK